MHEPVPNDERTLGIVHREIRDHLDELGVSDAAAADGGYPTSYDTVPLPLVTYEGAGHRIPADMRTLGFASLPGARAALIAGRRLAFERDRGLPTAA